jgi:hypothetical protein
MNQPHPHLRLVEAEQLQDAPEYRPPAWMEEEGRRHAYTRRQRRRARLHRLYVAAAGAAILAAVGAGAWAWVRLFELGR